jgi:nucleoside-diphosphate-sugar epimerase
MCALQGPVTSGDQGGVSVGFMKGILESPADKEFTGSWTVVDVRDVADAHIRAAEDPTAKGRCVWIGGMALSAGCVWRDG